MTPLPLVERVLAAVRNVGELYYHSCWYHAIQRADPVRTHRVYQHEFHLHYWELPGGTVELGCIGPHNHYDIPYCR